MHPDVPSPDSALLTTDQIASAQGWRWANVDGQKMLAIPAELLLESVDDNAVLKKVAMDTMSARGDIPRQPVPNLDNAYCVDPSSKLGQAILSHHPELGHDTKPHGKKPGRFAVVGALIGLGAKKPTQDVPGISGRAA